MIVADPAFARPARVLTATETRLWAFAGIITLAALPLMVALGLDDRVYQGDPVWLKPLKFHLALVVYFGTLAFVARWLPARMESARAWRWFLGTAMAMTVAELVWIGGAAALGVGSHFNVSTPVWQVIYGLMGVAATQLTALTLVMGVAILRGGVGLAVPMRQALGLGLVMTFGLTMLVAWIMASGAGHHVGVPVTGARVPLMGWSREVGDLRLPHFLATHALHVVPLAGFTGSRGVVWAAGAGYGALVLWAFGRALMGLPLLA